jgi:hypothetical protein
MHCFQHTCICTYVWKLHWTLFTTYSLTFPWTRRHYIHTYALLSTNVCTYVWKLHWTLFTTYIVADFSLKKKTPHTYIPMHWFQLMYIHMKTSLNTVNYSPASPWVRRHSVHFHCFQHMHSHLKTSLNTVHYSPTSPWLRRHHVRIHCFRHMYICRYIRTKHWKLCTDFSLNKKTLHRYVLTYVCTAFHIHTHEDLTEHCSLGDRVYGEGFSLLCHSRHIYLSSLPFKC